jgi:CRP-like cAMP-binding protein
VNLDPSAFVADPELIQGLDSQSTPVSCDEDRVLFRQGDSPAGLYILKSGSATLSMTTSASAEILSLEAAAGSLLGLPGLIGNEPYTLTAIAHAGAQLSYLTRENFTALMRSDPLLALKILQVLAAEVRSARSAILEQSGARQPRRRRLTHARQP